MRLLRTDSLELEEFFDDLPGYAILSHTWGAQEVSYQEMKNGPLSTKTGYSKIQQSCAQAALGGHKYMWIDTCCIDKSSSAELTEAINSMYKWYQKASICYVYLADVSKSDGDIHEKNSAFRNCRWFTRGWTLQELIAPSRLRFYDQEWNFLGDKTQLVTLVSEITRVDTNVLSLRSRIEDHPIARRMSWAATRQTTRAEDIAYSLMGLFNVNMPLLYGEGSKAFIRLQEEIMKDSDDHSIFAWRSDAAAYDGHNRGLLANSPSEFLKSSEIVVFRNWKESMPYSITNNGLSIRLDMVAAASRGQYVAALNCWSAADSATRVGIVLERIQGDQYARIDHHYLCSPSPYGYPPSPPTIFIRKEPVEIGLHDTTDGGTVFKLKCHKEKRWIIPVTAVYPIRRWQGSETAIFTLKSQGWAGVIELTTQAWGIPRIYILLGWSVLEKPYCLFRKAGKEVIPDSVPTPEDTGLGSDGWQEDLDIPGYTISALLKKQPVLGSTTIYDVYVRLKKITTKRPLILREIFGLDDDGDTDYLDFERLQYVF